jgi:hypothetical protein
MASRRPARPGRGHVSVAHGMVACSEDECWTQSTSLSEGGAAIPMYPPRPLIRPTAHRVEDQTRLSALVAAHVKQTGRGEMVSRSISDVSAKARLSDKQPLRHRRVVNAHNVSCRAPCDSLRCAPRLCLTSRLARFSIPSSLQRPHRLE